MRIMLVVPPALMILAIACGGSSQGPVLHLQGADISESDYRAWWRLGIDLWGVEVACSPGNLQDPEAHTDEIATDLPKGSSVVSGQIIDPESLRIAQGIML